MRTLLALRASKAFRIRGYIVAMQHFYVMFKGD